MVTRHSGSRAPLRALFELAEDSAAELDGCVDAGRVLVARDAGAIVGHLQLVETSAPRELEIKNMAVRPERRRRGVGRALMAAALDLARAEGRAIVIDGIELRDRVWLDRAVGA